VFYKLGLEGKTNPELEVEIIAQGKTLREDMSSERFITGEIRSEDDEIEIEVSIKSSSCGY
jgi:hypothetical protein